jgi:hypothetical protein
MQIELTAESILNEVNKYINEEVSYIDALIHYAEIHNIEVEIIGDIVRRSQIMKAKVHEDAEKLNLVEKTKRLQI